MLPIVVAQTNLSPEISFPYRSNPCAWRARFEPASRLTAAGVHGLQAVRPRLDSRDVHDLVAAGRQGQDGTEVRLARPDERLPADLVVVEVVRGRLEQSRPSDRDIGRGRIHDDAGRDARADEREAIHLAVLVADDGIAVPECDGRSP